MLHIYKIGLETELRWFCYDFGHKMIMQKQSEADKYVRRKNQHKGKDQKQKS
jgi:hypothetical protein